MGSCSFFREPTVPYTNLQSKSGKDHMDFKAWAEGLKAEDRDKTLKGIYLSAKMMKFHPAITKDLKKTYGLVASAALRAMTPEGKWEIKRAMHPYNSAKRNVQQIAKYSLIRVLNQGKDYMGGLLTGMTWLACQWMMLSCTPSSKALSRAKSAQTQHSHLKVSGQQPLMQNTRLL